MDNRKFEFLSDTCETDREIERIINTEILKSSTDLFFFNKITGEPQRLTSTQLVTIKNKYPNLGEIRVTDARSLGGGTYHFGNFQNVGYRDLLRCKASSKLSESFGSVELDLYVEIGIAIYEQFWRNHNKDNSPRSKNIVDWIVKNFKIAERNAEAIDKMIRPEEYRRKKT